MEFDAIIAKATVYDGTGREGYSNDLGIKDGKIAAIGNLDQASAKTRVDAKGLAVCPGFVDVHTHADMAIHQPRYKKLVEPMVRQGITTFVGGNCGVSMGPVSDKNADHQFGFYELFLGGDQRDRVTWKGFGDMLLAWEDQGVYQNVAALAPHSILRMHAMADDTSLASPDNMREMKKELAKCLEQGAVGMSTGLMYFPGLCSDERELTELAKVVHEYNGVFTSHLRSYNSDTLPKAIDEVLNIGEAAQVPVQISHLFWVPYFKEPYQSIMKSAIRAASKAYAIRPFPVPADSGAKKTLKKIARLVKSGRRIGVDAMPTSAGFTHLLAFFPPWSMEGGTQKALQRIADPITRYKIRKSIEDGEPVWPHRGRDSWSMNLFKVMGWDCASVMSVASEKNQGTVGKTFTQLGREQGKHPFDAACDLALEENGKVLIFETATYPGDPLVELSLRGTLVDPNVSIATDFVPIVFGRPSHLTYDCFPKFLGQYARDRNLLPMGQAVRKCTGLPASQLGLRNRGEIQLGNWADLVVFDPKNIGSRSTATDPEHFAAGIEYVFINGQVAVDSNGFHQNTRAGQVIRRGE